MIIAKKTNDLKLEDIPCVYEWGTFVKFALSFDPMNEQEFWSDTDHIPMARLPSILDSIIGIRGYLYSLQRINNQYIRDENELKERVEYAYKILRKKLES